MVRYPFQSTLPRGERLKQREELIKAENISIHAPTRGATLCFFVMDFVSVRFQSTLPRGERHRGDRAVNRRHYFNPRSHAGSDASAPGRRPRLANFNPRSHAGSDRAHSSRRRRCPYFNPRSHAGSDIQPEAFGSPYAVFQSTLPRGERQQLFTSLHSQLQPVLYKPYK